MKSYIPKKDMPGREVLSRKTEKARDENKMKEARSAKKDYNCLLYTSPSPRDS